MNSTEVAIRNMVRDFREQGLKPPTKIVIRQSDFDAFRLGMDAMATYGSGIVLTDEDAGGCIYWGVIVVPKKCTCGAL